MKHSVSALVAMVLVIILISCIFAQLYQQQNFASYPNIQGRATPLEIYWGMLNLQEITITESILPIFQNTLTLQVPNNGQSCLANYTRCQIFSYINQNPGVQFRALCSILCLPVGLVEYHLGVLVRAGLVSFIRDGRYKRFFVSKRFSKREMLAICLLRHKTTRRIIEVLLQKKKLYHTKLANEIAITPQALTWQMKTLSGNKFILKVNCGLKTFYSLDNSSVPLLMEYLAVIR